MPPDKSKYRAGNLTNEAWDALRDVKLAATSPTLQPNLSDAAIATARVAKAHPDELAAALAERKTTK